MIPPKKKKMTLFSFLLSLCLSFHWDRHICTSFIFGALSHCSSLLICVHCKRVLCWVTLSLHLHCLWLSVLSYKVLYGFILWNSTNWLSFLGLPFSPCSFPWLLQVLRRLGEKLWQPKKKKMGLQFLCDKVFTFHDWEDPNL